MKKPGSRHLRKRKRRSSGSCEVVPVAWKDHRLKTAATKLAVFPDMPACFYKRSERAGAKIQGHGCADCDTRRGDCTMLLRNVVARTGETAWACSSMATAIACGLDQRWNAGAAA